MITADIFVISLVSLLFMDWKSMETLGVQTDPKIRVTLVFEVTVLRLMITNSAFELT